jgi:hypothetical protein
LDLYSGSSLNQQSAGRHVAQLGHILLILSQQNFALTTYCCVISVEARHTNLIVFGLTPTRLEPMIHRTQGEHVHHYTTDPVNPLVSFSL